MDGLKIDKITLSADACWSILETAVSAGRYGIGYWGEAQTLERQSDSEMTLVVDDMEGREPIPSDEPHGEFTQPKRHRLHASQVRTAVLAILRDPHGTEAVGTAERIVSQESPDGPTADHIIQVACYGKVLYG